MAFLRDSISYHYCLDGRGLMLVDICFGLIVVRCLQWHDYVLRDGLRSFATAARDAQSD